MIAINERNKVVIAKFQELLRSGKDYSVESMYNEAGRIVYIKGISVKSIIQNHYKKVITQEMIDYLNDIKCCREDEIESFSDKFNVCRRESILLIRYIRRR